MSRFLTVRTPPFGGKIPRRHAPTRRRYEDFRSCLRWEFGFTCAICLLHERDVVPLEVGAEGTRQFWIEHTIPRSDPAVGAERKDDYTNGLYTCAFCNHARRDRPRVSADGRLLNPIDDDWSQHFEWKDDHLEPTSTFDRDATRTRNCYEINDSNRTVRRAARKRSIEDLERDIQARLDDIRAVDEELGSDRLDEVRRQQKRSQRNRWAEEARRKRDALRDHFRGIPQDRPLSCECAHPDTNCQVPAVVKAGWRDLPDYTIPELPRERPRKFRA